MADFRFETQRLILRDWREGDFMALHDLCTDPQVMATIGPVHHERRTRDLLDRLRERQARDGCTFWAMERKLDARVLGWCGVGRGTVPQLERELEIGWRLASDCWGQSYAREAAEATLGWIAGNHPAKPVWAITWAGNVRSRGLMERLGMQYRPELNFEHPGVEATSGLRPHVTYWLEQAA
jgi:RimJ/RimL family protein N-acetyltransferase